jgi:hypothetical protein
VQKQHEEALSKVQSSARPFWAYLLDMGAQLKQNQPNRFQIYRLLTPFGG